MISLCMIVKNEESNLARCLGNVRNKVDEIVIVDTGSTDNTKEIATRYTKKVYDFEWCDDFAAARNYSISKAENDWILILDADEVVNYFNKKSLTKFMTESKEKAGRINRLNSFEDISGRKKYFERVNRFFNKKYFRYEGIIHEQVVRIDGEDYLTTDIDIAANHIGYEKEILNKTNKIDRNKKLLQRAIADNRVDPYLYYQLGKTFFMEKNYLEAANNFEMSIKLGIDIKYEYVEDLIESYGYALINSERYEAALTLKKYEEEYKNIADYNFVMGLIYMNNAKFEEAVNKFIQCQNAKECKIEGVNSYQANYNIAVIYECLGIHNEAVKYYKKCGNYEPAVKRLKILK